MSMNERDWLPLFPLQTVLFPGGVLPLRVFETRYVDMVRERMKANAPFGVVAIRSGAEVGTAAKTFTIGTLATIVEWDMPELGVLLLQTRGGERFRILDTRVQANQLVEARIELLTSQTATDTSDALAVCSNVLEVVINDLLERSQAQSGETFINPFPEPHELQVPGWVANRWSEMLPISLEDKQSLLELEDDGERLLKVEQYLRENGVM